jgi:hypothetical protein
LQVNFNQDLATLKGATPMVIVVAVKIIFRGLAQQQQQQQQQQQVEFI